MDIKIRWLKNHNACAEAVEAFEKEQNHDDIYLLNKMIETHFDWANWLVTMRLQRLDRIRYAIYAASQVIEIYEKQCPNDDRPRRAIQAAKEYLKHSSKKNRAAYTAYAVHAAHAVDAAAGSAAYTARAAAGAAYAAAGSAAYAAYAAYAAAYTAYTAHTAHTARAAAGAAHAAAGAAGAAHAAGARKMKIKIVKYGIKLLNDGRRK